MLVTDLPIWAECPWAVTLKRPELEIRRGLNPEFGEERIVIWDPVMQQHMDIPANTTVGSKLLKLINKSFSRRRYVMPRVKRV